MQKFNLVPRVSPLPFPLSLQGKGRGETLGTRLAEILPKPVYIRRAYFIRMQKFCLLSSG